MQAKEAEKARERLGKLSVTILNGMCDIFDVARGSGDEGKKVRARLLQHHARLCACLLHAGCARIMVTHTNGMTKPNCAPWLRPSHTAQEAKVQRLLDFLMRPKQLSDKVGRPGAGGARPF